MKPWRLKHLSDGPAILTQSGGYFDFTKPDEYAFNITDVAGPLSRICRFTGHTSGFYSVAQHSVLCSYLVPKAFALAALLHDAHEAYVGDVSSPLKMMLPDYRLLEDRVAVALRRAFGVPEVMPPEVQTADMAMLAIEQQHVVCNGDDWQLPAFDVMQEKIALYWTKHEAAINGHKAPGFVLWASGLAEYRFVARYHELGGPERRRPIAEALGWP